MIESDILFDRLAPSLDKYKPQSVTHGQAIDLNNFRHRTWEKVLKELDNPYRKLYQTRHTFTTHALETGRLDAKDVARLVGNSPKVIYQHYAGTKRELIVPEF